MANWIERFLAAIATHKSNASAHHTKTTAGELNLADMAEKAHGSLTGVSANQHHPQAHTLGSHSTKAHSELTGVTSDLHHPQSHNAASHSDIASSGANIDDAVTKRHSRSHDHSLAADGTPIAVSGVPNLPASKVTSLRFPVDRLPAMTNNKIWKGTGTNVEEVDMPAGVADTTLIKVGDTLRNSNDTQRSTESEPFVKVKEVKLNEDLPNCRLKFDIEGNSTGADGRVYKNGAAIGTLHGHGATEWTTYSEDFSGWVTNDLIQIYAKGWAAAATLIKNMRFCYDIHITKIGGVSLVTSLVSDDDATISASIC